MLFLWITYLVCIERCSLVEINDWFQVSVCLNCLTGLIWSTGFEATKRESSADSPGDLVRSQILFLYFILFFQPTMSWFLVNSFCKCRPTKTMCSTRQVFEFLKKVYKFLSILHNLKNEVQDFLETLKKIYMKFVLCLFTN